MQFTQKCRETVDACRFCWMCRHICPIGNVTGQERNTARARALGLSMVARDREKLENCIDNVYECSLCGACVKECKTGWDPTLFVAEAKLEAALAGITPDYINSMLDKSEKTGNVYGVKKYSKFVTAETKDLPETADVLLFLGQDALCKAPKAAAAAIRLLKAAGVNFTVLSDEPSSGYDLYFLVGAAEETRQAMMKTAEKLAAFKKVVVYDPNDAKFFTRQYKEWNIPFKPEIKTFTSFLADLIRTKKLAPKKSASVYTFQDPAALARDLEETAPARKILAACGTLNEFLLNGKDVMIAGSLFMNEYLPNVMADVARSRWQNAIDAEAKIVVTASPSDYVCLAEVKPNNVELMSIEEVVLKCL